MKDEPPDLFRSAWLKWGWATAHSELLKSYAREAGLDIQKKGQVTGTQSYDAKRHCIVVIASDVPKMPERLGLILGDTVGGFRSCLDHLAWALVKRGRTPNLTERQEIDVQFPICTERQAFNDSIRRRLPGVRRADIANVRGYQPYKVGKRNRPRHPFVALAKLARYDKHRSVQPIWVLPRGSRYQVTSERDCVLTRGQRYGRIERLEVGAEMARFYVRRTGPNPELEMKGQIMVEPFVDEFVMLGDWVTKTSQLIALLLARFAEPPEGLIDDIAPEGSEHVFP